MTGATRKATRWAWEKTTIISLRFMTKVGKGQMIAALRDLHDILMDQDYKVKGESVRCAVELGPERRPMEEAQATFFEGHGRSERRPGETTGQLGETSQITTYAKFGDERRSEVAATFVWEGEYHANESWAIVLGQICADFDDILVLARV